MLTYSILNADLRDVVEFSKSSNADLFDRYRMLTCAMVI